MKAEIKTVVLTYGDKKLELTIEEAKAIQAALNNLLDKPAAPFKWPEPAPYIPSNPLRPPHDPWKPGKLPWENPVICKAYLGEIPINKI